MKRILLKKYLPMFALSKACLRPQTHLLACVPQWPLSIYLWDRPIDFNDLFY